MIVIDVGDVTIALVFAAFDIDLWVLMLELLQQLLLSFLFLLESITVVINCSLW